MLDGRRMRCGSVEVERDPQELPWLGRGRVRIRVGEVGNQRAGTVSVRDEQAVGVGLDADRAVGVPEYLELLPGPDRGTVGDQRAGTTGLGADELAVRPGLECHKAAALVDLVKVLPRTGADPVGDQRLGSARLR